MLTLLAGGSTPLPPPLCYQHATTLVPEKPGLGRGEGKGGGFGFEVGGEGISADAERRRPGPHPPLPLICQKGTRSADMSVVYDVQDDIGAVQHELT